MTSSALPRPYSDSSPSSPSLGRNARTNGHTSSYSERRTSGQRSDSPGHLSPPFSGSFGNQRKMTNTVRSSNRSAILAVGEELRLLLHEEEPPLIKDRRYHLKTYSKSFVGHDMVDWLLKKGEVESRREAVAMMQKLLENGVIHHVCDDHLFKDEKLFYRFRKDDGTYTEPADSAIIARGQRIYSRITSDGSNLIQDRKYLLSSYKRCFVGRELIDWLISKGEATTREEAHVLGLQMEEAGVLRHVCDDHHFKDEYLFYRFKNDEKPSHSPRLGSRLGIKKSSSKKTRSEDDAGSQGSMESRGSGASWDSLSTGEVPARRSPEADEYIHMSHASPTHSPQPSPLPTTHAPHPTPPPMQTNGLVPAPATTTGPPRRPTVEELTDPDGSYIKRAVDVVSDPVGYGFVIRGSRPVYVHTIDPSGPAAAAGLQVGEYLYSVNGQVVLNASHTDAARIILMGSSTASLVTFVLGERLHAVRV